MRPWSKFVVLTTATFAVGLLARVGPAAAAPSCSFQAAQARVVVSLPGNLDMGTIDAGFDGSIRLNGSACGSATVTNADKVKVTGGAGNQIVTISLEAGSFAPGKTNEVGSSDEIEFSVTLGSGGDSLYVLGTSEDDLYGDQGADTLRAHGPNLTFFYGGPGDDKEIGAGGADDFRSSAVDGADLIDGKGGVDYVSYNGRSAGVNVSVDGIANDGDPTVGGGAGEGDNVKNVEYIDGTAFDDILVGSGADDSITGREGAGTLQGRGGADFISGGIDGDRITGGTGQDDLNGDAGADKLFAMDGEVDDVDGGVDADTDTCSCDPADNVTTVP